MVMMLTPAGAMASDTKYKSISSAEITLIKNLKSDVLLNWKKVSGVSRYVIYRKADGSDKWKKVRICKGGDRRSGTDTKKRVSGKAYTYRVIAQKKVSAGSPSAEFELSSNQLPGKAVNVWVASIKLKSTIKTGITVKKVRWNKDAAVDGYQIQYSYNSLFTSVKKRTADKYSQSMVLSKLKPGKKVYVRIRAYKRLNGKKYYSAWTTSKNARKSIKAKYKYKKNLIGLKEYRALTGQEMYGYDTFQGGTSDGKYLYNMMYNRNAVNCKVAKIKAGSGKVVKVSNVKEVGHGNGMAYNKDKKILVISNFDPEPFRLTVMNPKTLKVIKNVKVKLPKTLTGISAKMIKKIKGLSTIAYEPGRHQYVVTLYESKDFMILNQNFKPVQYVSVTKRPAGYQGQDIACTSEYVIRAFSPTGGNKYNILAVYDWEGNYIKKIKLNPYDEVEYVTIAGSKVYCGVYATGYETKTKTIVVKVKKKNGKYKKKKKKISYQVFRRYDYIYKLTKF